MNKPLTNNDKESFRDKVSTVGEKGKRLWLFPKKPKGKLYTYRTILSWFQLAFLFIAPFIKIGGEPLIMLNVIERKFVLFGKAFWTQDFYIFALLLICFFLGIILFTAIFGRVWCGWFCPQTIFMEMLFRKIEYFIEGDWVKQKRLATLPFRGQKLVKKIIKFSLFFILSWIIGNLLLAYIIGGDGLIELITDNPLNHLGGLTTMTIFTLAFFWLYGYFREQFCTFLCPYARLQSVMLDNNSLVVAYNNKRGETRAKAKERQLLKTAGDCVDCGICVQVCPTGIDIRNGTPQLECINCAACIDGCNNVMKKIGKPLGLISYSSKNNLEKGEKFKITPRILSYSTALLALIVISFSLIFMRPDVSSKILRAPGQTYQLRENERISNLYNGIFINKTSKEINLQLISPDKDITMNIISFEKIINLPPLKETKVTFFIERDKNNKNSKVPLQIYFNEKLSQEMQLSFIKP